MKIINKKFNGKGFRKYSIYIYVEIRHILWKIFRNRKDKIFVEGCTFSNFRVYKNETYLFWLAAFIYYSLLKLEEQKEKGRIII